MKRHIDKPNRLSESYGALQPGKGMVSGADRDWPDRYGVVGDYVPNGFLKQLAFPFHWKG